MHAELSKLGAQARTWTTFPLLDPTVFGEIMQAIFRESLGLSEEQLAEMHDAIGAAFAGMPENLEDLRPLDRHRLKNELMTALWTTLDRIVGSEQRQSLGALQKYTELFLREGNLQQYGLGFKEAGLLEDMMERHIESTYKLREDQMATVKGWLSGWVTEGEAIVRRYGHDEAVFDQLAPIQRAAMEREFLDVQTRFEEKLLQILDDDQRSHLYESAPTFFRFALGSGSSSIAYGQAF